MITVGCAGFPVPATRYFKEFLFVEVQETHVAPPGSGTVRRWRREAPDGFRFAMVGPREIGQEGFRDGMVVETALKTLETVGKELAADTVILVAPPDFPASRANKTAVKELLTIVRQRFERVIFDPAVGWDPDETETMATEVGAIAARDPLTAGISRKKEAYYRLPGPAGHKSRYEDPAIDRLGELARSVPEQDATYVFTNVDMFADARRLKKVLKLLSGSPAAPKNSASRGTWCATKGGLMAACVQCQAEVPPGAPCCSGCGAASLSALEIPDLDLAPASVRPAPAPRRAPVGLELNPATQPARMPELGSSSSGLDVDELPDASGLELAVTPIQRNSRLPPRPAAPAAAPQRASIPPPARRVSVPDASGPDPYEVQQIARFGVEPQLPWESVFYALRVALRLRALKEELTGAKATMDQHRKAADEALVTFLDASQQKLLSDAAFARLFEPLRELQTRYLERLAEIESLDREGQDALAAIDAEILQAERTAQEGRSTREGLASEAARLFDASREGDALATQLLGAIREQMQKAEEDATRAVSQMNDLRRRRRESEQSYVQRIRTLEEALAVADGPRKAALLEIGRDLLDRLPPGLEGFSAVESAARRLQESTRRCSLLEASLLAYNRQKALQGWLLLGAFSVLLIGAMVLGIMRMNRELSAPPPTLPSL
jgi:uncharacterized protein YecE (DUF72 family)